jgi:hypothetical protein
MNATLESIDAQNDKAGADQAVQFDPRDPQIDAQPGSAWNQWLKSFATWRQTLSKLGEGKLGEESR